MVQYYSPYGFIGLLPKLAKKILPKDYQSVAVTLSLEIY
jgi:hypothetical protein